MKYVKTIGFLLSGVFILSGCGGGTESESFVNLAPIATAQNLSLNENKSIVINFNGTDANGDILTYRTVTNPSKGTLNGTTYTPNIDYVGHDNFTFVANDGTVDSVPSSINIIVMLDTDGDNISDVSDDDDDNDGFKDSVEVTVGTDPLDPSDKPIDTDGDGSPDSIEIAAGTDPNDPTSIPADIYIKNDYQVESLGMASSIQTKINLGTTPKDVYILLSNYATSNGSVQITKSNKSIATLAPASNKRISTQATRIHAPEHVEDFRKNMHKYMHKNIQSPVQLKVIATNIQKKDVALDTQRFYLGETQSSFTDATARKIVSNVATAFGDKTLNVWVSNDSFGNCNKRRCVTQEMVDALASTFLTNGNDNDIYDWVSNIYGDEWGVHNESRYIVESNDITILLTDISNDNSISGGVLGFFFPKDNFIRSEISGSNERVMLYADAVLFANGEGTSWGIDDYWPREMMSTLAHEFQHVIHFYQKSVLREVNTDVWINEMLSESVEDLVATKLKHTGSRGVAYTDGSAGESGNSEGRYPLFNSTNTLSLTSWQGKLANYSHVNAFGAYLLRNYGGAKVLHDILHNNDVDEKAVVLAVNQAANGEGKTFNDLLKEWGIAVLLSDNDTLDTNLPTYNTGDFTYDTYNQSTYALGSIDFFNYNPQPNLASSIGTIEKQGNYYYKVGSKLEGNISIDLSLNGQTEVTLITKESK